MRVLIACEFSGTVREAFRRRGHDAWSCDLLPTEKDGKHIEGDAFVVIYQSRPWDLLIAHPPCTYLANSGVKWLYRGGRKENGPDPERWEKMRVAAKFFRDLLQAPINHIAVENPVMHEYAAEEIGSRADQFVQPWMFGHGEVKATGLHLKNLPPLKPTRVVDGRTPRVHYASPGPDRWKERSRTMWGIADAMAEQWGSTK